MKLETLDLDPQSNTLPGISVVGFHGELTPDQTPARSQPIWVDNNNRMVSLVEPGRLRRHADLPAPPPGKLWIERISDVELASSSPLPGVGTRIGPWTPARPAWIVATLGPRELKILSSLRVDDSNHPRVDKFLLWLSWLAAGEEGSDLHCERDGQLVHWYCAAADELELRRRIRMVAENALVTDARAQAPAQLQKTSFWLARAATRDEDIYRAAAGLAYPTGEPSPRVDSLLGMLTHKCDAAERQRHFAAAGRWLAESISALKRQDYAAASLRGNTSVGATRYREQVRNPRVSSPYEAATSTTRPVA